jgi:hypothetical protein
MLIKHLPNRSPERYRYASPSGGNREDSRSTRPWPWDMTPCSLVDVEGRFRGTCCFFYSENGGGTFLRNSRMNVPHSMTSLPRRDCSKISINSFWFPKSIIHIHPSTFCAPPLIIFSVYRCACLSLQSVVVGQSISIVFWTVTPCGLDRYLPTFRRNILRLSSGKMEAAESFKMWDPYIKLNGVNPRRL